MVPLSERDEFIADVRRDDELRPICAFLFGEAVRDSLPGKTTRADLFEALRLNDSQKFTAVVDALARRKLSPKSEWIGDDCMVFLLLVGCRKFKREPTFVKELLRCRDSTTNAVPRRVNQTFEAIHAGEFAMEGDFAFIKCVFRHITEKWRPNDDECIKLYAQLTKSGTFADFDPFLKLVGLRAFDLVIESRAPAEAEERTWEQIFSRIQEHGGKLTVGQFFRLLKHLRLTVIGVICGVVLAIFGLGTQSSKLVPVGTQQDRERPTGNLAYRVHPAHRDGRAWVRPFVQFLQNPVDLPPTNTHRIVVLTLETEPFRIATTAFSMEVTMHSATNLVGYCFSIIGRGADTQLVPIETIPKGSGLSLHVPVCEKDSRLLLLVRAVVPKEQSAGGFERDFTLSVIP